MQKRMTLAGFFKEYRKNLLSKKTKKKYYWGFLGDILGELILPTDEEIIDFAQRDFQETISIRFFIQPWIMPGFFDLTDESRERIKNTLSWYLHQPEKELDLIVNAFQLPIPIASSKQFYTVIWQEFFLSDFPDPIDPEEYEEDTSPEFINTLYKTFEKQDWSDVPYYSSPERLGTVRTDLVEWYDPELSLEALKRWATTGVRPNLIQGLMSDASKWLTHTDYRNGREEALKQFEAMKAKDLFVERITLDFDHDIGIGFLKGTVTPVKTRRARFLFDRLGNMLAAYPILK